MNTYSPILEAPFSTLPDGRRVLQCHSRGDKRFSPFCCPVTAFGVHKSIEDHYQSSKIFENGEVVEGELQPANWREAKRLQKAGKRQVAWRIGHIKIVPVRNASGDSFTLADFGIQFYIGLWHKYLLANPHLVEIAREFDEFEDPFRGKFPFCQADVIRQCVSHGIDSLKPMYAELAGHIRNFTLPASVEDEFAYSADEWIELLINKGKPHIVGQPTMFICGRSSNGDGLTSVDFNSLPESDRRIIEELQAELRARRPEASI